MNLFNHIPTPCKKDCPNRCVGCAAQCPDWAEYVERRNKQYEDHVKRVTVAQRTTASSRRKNRAIYYTKNNNKK